MFVAGVWDVCLFSFPSEFGFLRENNGAMFVFLTLLATASSFELIKCFLLNLTREEISAILILLDSREMGFKIAPQKGQDRQLRSFSSKLETASGKEWFDFADNRASAQSFL